MKNRLIFLTIFLLLIDKIVFLFFPAFPGGLKHFLVFLFVLYNWYASGPILYKYGNNYLLLICFNLIYIILLFFYCSVQPINFTLGYLFTYLFSIVFILSSNTKLEISLIFKSFKFLIYIFLPLSLITIISSVITGEQINTSYFGVFRELGAFGTVLNISAILCLVLFIKTEYKFYILLASIFSFFIILTIMKKAIISNLIIWFIYFFSKGSIRQKILQSVAFTCLFVGAIFFMKDALIDNVNKNIDYATEAGEEHVRIAMYNAAFRISSDHFPFGSGTGTFGSLPSLYNGYSKVYYDYGISLIEPLSPERVLQGEGHDLFDTYWPHILGELGVLGTIFFIFLWFYPIFKSIRYFKYSDNNIKALSFYIISIGIVMFVEGFVLYTPEISAFIIFHSVFTGLCFYHLYRCNFSKYES